MKESPKEVVADKVAKPRKVVTNVPELVLFTKLPEDVRRKVLYFVDVMTEISFANCLKLAMAESGLAEHPVYASQSVSELTEAVEASTKPV